MANPFDQFDAPTEANPFDAFDVKPPVKGGLVASAKQAIGSTIKGAGQAAADFLPGVGQDNALKTYGQSVVDANPTAVHSLADLKANPLTGVAEATGNAGGSMGAMLGARALGTGITAAAPFTGPAAPLVAGLGQGIAWLGPMAAAALPSFGGIREQQIKDDPNRQDSIGAKALAAAGAGTVGLIESKFGPQEWALSAMSKEGRGQLAEKFAAKTLGGSVAKGAAKGAAIEGAEEIAQNPIEQIASYQNPLTADNLKDTAFSGVMGALGGGVLGGASGAAFRKGADNKPAATPEVAPADQSIPYAPTTVEEVAKQRADAMGVKPENGPISAAASLAIEGQTAEEMRLATPGILAQGAAAAEHARLAQEARQAAEPGIPYEPVAVEVPQAAPTTPRARDTVPPPSGSFSQMDELAQFVGQEKADKDSRLADIASRQQAAQSAADAYREERLAEIDQTVADNRQRQAETARLDLLHSILSDAEVANPAERFSAELARQGYRNATVTPQEATAIQRHGELKQAFEGWQNPATQGPKDGFKQMQDSADFYGLLGQERADLEQHRAALQKPAPAPQPKDKHQAVADLVASGATMKGRDLVSTTGKVVMKNLNLMQAAKARQFIRERNTIQLKPNAQAAETPAPSVPVQAAPQGQKQQSAGVANPVIKESLTTQTPATIKPDLTVQALATGKQSLQVQPENSNGNARPASEKVSPVSPAQGGVNAGGVGNLRADKGSGTGGQAVRNDAAEPAASVPDSRAGGSGERVRQTNLITLVRQAGGVSLDSKADVTGDKNSRETLGVFRKSGMSLDRLAEVLQQNGYITESEVSDVMSGAEKASELLRDALAGNRPLNMADNERAMSDAEEAKQRDAIRKKADELGIKWRFRKTEDVEAEINQREEVAPEDRSAYDYSSESVQDFSDEFDIFNDITPLTGKAAMRAIGFTEEEINEAIQSESRQGQTGSTESAGTQSRRADSGSQAGSSEQGGILESYSEKDLAARDEAQRLKAEEKARADKAADDKARADSERDSFTLTGSDRTTDVQAVQGQGDIFDSSPAQKESPASVSTESNPARSAPSEEALIDIGLLRDRGDRWQYKFSIGSGWMTANIKSDAVDRATTTYFSTPENERLTRKERAERANNELIAHMEKTYGNMSISNLDAKYRSLGGAISDLHRAGAKEFNGNGRRSTSSAVSNEAARSAGTEKLHLGIYIKHRQSLIDEESAKSSANQNPIKAETRASTGPETESASANQETVKPSPALESLFADLDSSTVRKANKAKKAAKLHPQAAEIDYVQNNYHDILIQLMDAGKLEVNGSKSVTEENKSCL